MINFLAPNFFMQMFYVFILCRQSIRLFHQKLWYKLIGMHKHYLCINKIHYELQRAITLIELAPSPYFSMINVYLEDINVFARFDEIPSLPVEIIREKAKRRGRTERRTDGQRENSVPPPPRPRKLFAGCIIRTEQSLCDRLMVFYN